MSEDKTFESSKIEEFADNVKDLAYGLRANICPVWQCGGELEHIEEAVIKGDDDTNWQEPNLKCKNCGALFKFIREEDKRQLIDSDIKDQIKHFHHVKGRKSKNKCTYQFDLDGCRVDVKADIKIERLNLEDETKR
jgi:hypothetical protein